MLRRRIFRMSGHLLKRSVLFAFWFAGTAGAVIVTPSLNISNARSADIIFYNPSGIAVPGHFQAVAGSQNLWTGLSGDRLLNHFAGLILPVLPRTSVGMQTHFFTSRLFQEGEISLCAARSFIDGKMAAGLSAGMVWRSYDVSEFDLVDVNDPLLSGDLSRAAFSCGFGILVRPMPCVTAGFSVNHLNRPDLSMQGSDYQQKPVFNAGIDIDSYLLKPGLDVTWRDGRMVCQLGIRQAFLDPGIDLFAGVHGSAGRIEDIFLRTGYYFRQWGVSWFYRYPVSALNTVTNGSHGLVLTCSPAIIPAGRFRPEIILMEPARAVMRQDIYPLDMAARHIHGISGIDVYLNGIIRKHWTYDERPPEIRIRESILLSEGGNHIRVIAFAGNDTRTMDINIRYRPSFAPPDMDVFSDVPSETDTGAVDLRVAVSDAHGLLRVILINNGRVVKRLDFNATRMVVKHTFQIPLSEGENSVILFAANDDQYTVKKFRITYKTPLSEDVLESPGDAVPSQYMN